MTVFEQLTKIRELVDELYDNTQPHTSTNSMLFLEINQAIDETQRYIRKCESGSLYGKAALNEGEYINGTDLDCDYDMDVNDILAAMKRDREENRRIY